MRVIVEGKAYDTETATLLAEANARRPRNDFGFWAEELYRTATGAYFLHGEGGAATSWATHYGNSSSAGDGLRPLTEDEAREWVERYANDRYESIFGPAPEA